MATQVTAAGTKGPGDWKTEHLFTVSPPAKRARARKLRTPLGPYETCCTHFDAGTRAIEIVRLTASVITYRLKGRHEEYSITHAAAFQRAVCASAGFDAGPREGKRITRGATG